MATTCTSTSSSTTPACSGQPLNQAGIPIKKNHLALKQSCQHVTVSLNLNVVRNNNCIFIYSNLNSDVNIYKKYLHKKIDTFVVCCSSCWKIVWQPTFLFLDSTDVHDMKYEWIIRNVSVPFVSLNFKTWAHPWLVISDTTSSNTIHMSYFKLIF